MSSPPRRERARIETADRQQVRWEMRDLEAELPDDHRARVIVAAVERMDLSAFYEQIRARGSAPGRPALDPAVLLSLWLFATSEGVGSAKHLERLCQRDLPYRWICGGMTPNAHSLSDFRAMHGDKLDTLMTQLLASLMHKGLVKLRRVTQDGMRLRAHAGTGKFHRKPKLEEQLEEARAQIATLKAELESDTSASLDREQAAKMRAAAERQRKLEAALNEMPKVARTHERTRAQRARNAAKQGKSFDDDGPRVSTTDPEARVMKMGDGGFRPAYNLQYATDTESRVIVGVAVTNVGSDRSEMVPMLEQIERRTNVRPSEYLVDGGFANLEAITTMEQRGVCVYAPVRKQRNSDSDPHARKPGDSDEVARWRARMATTRAQEVYKQRGSVAETINADQRHWRGMTRARLVGQTKVLAQARMGVLLHNVLRAHALGG